MTGEVGGLGAATRIQSRAVNVPILDLGRVHQRIASQLDERWRRILDQSSFILGPEVKEFESAFAAYPGRRGLRRSRQRHRRAAPRSARPRRQAGGRGDRPRVQLLRHRRGGGAARRPRSVFCDVDPESLNLDPADVAARVTERTVGVIGVHLYGRPFDVDALLDGLPAGTGSGCSRTPPRRTARSGRGSRSAASASSRRGASTRPRTSAASATAAR